eukprot:Hpha_TRINITY_DN6828_c0_g1::TRINITY_DN6828_c0_g1_i1::g.46170::m.46170
MRSFHNVFVVCAALPIPSFASDAEGATAEKETSSPYSEPHFYMRPHMYVDHERLRDLHPTDAVPPRRLSEFHRMVKIEGEPPGGIEPGARVRLRAPGDYGPFSTPGGDVEEEVEIGSEVLRTRDATGKSYACHLPKDSPLEGQLENYVGGRTLVDAHDALERDIGSGDCWYSSFDNWGLEYCWNKTVKKYGLVGGGGVKSNETVLGKHGEVVHSYTLAADPGLFDPLALYTVYDAGDDCVTTDAAGDNTTVKWQTQVWFHCTSHSSEKRASRFEHSGGEQRGELNRKAAP